MAFNTSCPSILTGTVPPIVEFGLSADIWERIFKMLNFKSLLTVRSTCLRWKQIVDGSSPITNRWRVKMEDLEIDRDFQPISVVPARSAELLRTRISCIGPWWALLGENLRSLDLIWCQMSTSMLMKLLQSTPNLEFLRYVSHYPVIADICTEGIRLNKLKHLAVESPEADILDVFRKICPGVRSFTANQSLQATKLAKYLKESSEIEELNLRNNCFFKDIDLQLNHVTSLKLYENSTSDFSCLHGLNLGDIFPELKSFTLECLSGYGYVKELAFLNNVNNLERLSLQLGKPYNCSQIDFSTFKLRNLMEIKLRYVDLGHKSMYNFLKNVSPFCKLEISACNNESKFFAAIEQTQSIQYLSLNSMIIDEVPSEYVDSLKCLKLSEVSIPTKLLIALIKLCPQLNEIVLKELYTGIDDEVMQALCEKLKHLEILSIKSCSVTDRSVDHIVNNCKKLRLLRIEGKHTLSDEGRSKLSHYINGLYPSNSRVEIVKTNVS